MKRLYLLLALFFSAALYSQQEQMILHGFSYQYKKSFFSDVMTVDTVELHFTKPVKGKNTFFQVHTNRMHFIYYNDTYYFRQNDTWTIRPGTFIQIYQHHYFSLYQPLIMGHYWYEKKTKNDSFVTQYRKKAGGRTDIYSHSIIQPDEFIDSLSLFISKNARGVVDSFYTEAFMHGKAQQFGGRLLSLDSFSNGDLDYSVRVLTQPRKEAILNQVEVLPKPVDTLEIIEKAVEKYGLKHTEVILDISYIRCAPCLKLGDALDLYAKEHQEQSIACVNLTDTSAALIDWYRQAHAYHFSLFFDTLSPLKMFSVRTFPTIILFNRTTRKYSFLWGYSKDQVTHIRKEFLRLAE